MTAANQGRVLGGRFRLESLLGQGGMGAVYVATDLSINRHVAIKLLRPEVAEDPESLERMREEAISLAALRHPNVVQLYDFYSSSPESTFLLMELVDGVSLAKRIDREGPLPLASAIDYTRQVLSALAAAHSKGIIHRDIKPGNVLVVSVPMQRDLVKVLDFGIAKLTEETIRRRPTTAGMLLGTPSYMSPEQATGKPIDTRSDIYAAGLLFYTMLAGHNPFAGLGDIAATLIRVQSVMPTPIDRIRADVPPALAEVLSVAMDKNPNQRFQTAAELVQAIDWAASGERSIRSAPPSPIMRASHAPLETTTRVPARGAFDERSMSIGSAMTLASANPPSMATHSVSVRSRDEKPRKRMSTGLLVMIVVLTFFGSVALATLGVLTYVVGGFFKALADVGKDAKSTPYPSPLPIGGGETFPCTTNAQCAQGLECMYDEAGCQAQRHCRRSAGRTCEVGVPMCSCNDHRSFSGPGGCAGLASEPWEPYPCACNGDADCGGGQRCVAVTTDGRPHRPGATRECRVQ